MTLSLCPLSPAVTKLHQCLWHSRDCVHGKELGVDLVGEHGGRHQALSQLLEGSLALIRPLEH